MRLKHALLTLSVFVAATANADPLVEGSAGKWLKVNDPNALNDALSSLRKTVPKDGTSLVRLTKLDITKDPYEELMKKIDVRGRPVRGAAARSGPARLGRSVPRRCARRPRPGHFEECVRE